MRLSVFTTASDPGFRGDNYIDALNCYDELADEVVLIEGRSNGVAYEKALTEFDYWPHEFSWERIGQQFQRGYEECSGDWVIHADLDFMFHQKDFGRIRQALKDAGDAPALSFYKWQFILPDRYNLKSRLVIAVNKARYGDRIRFDSGGDLCQPSLDGKELKPEDVPQAGIEFYNYEKLLKSEAQIKDDVGRMARAWHEYWKEYKLGGPDDESAYEAWLQMTLGRFAKPHQKIPLYDHPKYVQETIKNLKPENFGYSGFGNLETNSYML